MERDPLPHADRPPDAGEEPPAEAAVTPASDAAAPRKRLSARGKRLVTAGAIAVVGALVGAGLAFASYLANVNQELTQGDKTVEEVEEIEEVLAHHSDFTEPFYLLLIGSDARPEDPSMGARSDTNILARVDPVADQVTLVSIPRDTKVTIPGHGTCKFNAAYAYGGVPGVIRATNDLLGVEVAHYAEVNFDKLMELVDALGGVDVEVDMRIDDVKADYNTYDRHNVIEPGLQHLDGSHALTFARSRAFPDGDFTRTAHQRTLIMAIVNQALGLSPAQLPAVVEAGAKCVTTDLTITQILDLALQFRDAGDLVIYSAMLPSFTQNIGGVSYVINDAEATAEMMALVEAGEDPSGIVSTKSAADVGGSGAATASSAPAAPTEPAQPEQPAAPEQPPATQPGGDAGAGTISGKPGAGEGAGGDAKPPAGGDGGGTDAGGGKPGGGASDGGSSGGSAGSTKPGGSAGGGSAKPDSGADVGGSTGSGGGAAKPDAGATGGKQPAGGAPVASSAPTGSAAGAAAGKAA